MKLWGTHNNNGVISFRMLVHFMHIPVFKVQCTLKESTIIVVFNDNIFMMMGLDMNPWLRGS